MPERSFESNTDISVKMLEFSMHELNKAVLSYNGPFENKVLYTLGSYIRKEMDIPGISEKKLFSIFMEMAQNIAFYSDETILLNGDQKAGVGLILMQEFNDYFLLTTGNKLNKKEVSSLQEKLNTINTIDRFKLRELKRDQRKAPPGERGGANIGLIKVALASTYPIEVNAYYLDEDYSFISFVVRVDKH